MFKDGIIANYDIKSLLIVSIINYNIAITATYLHDCGCPYACMLHDFSFYSSTDILNLNWCDI